MHALAEAMRTELDVLELLLHRLTTLRLMMATGKHRSIERAAGELEVALEAAAAAEARRTTTLRESGHTSLQSAIDATDEPMRTDLSLAGGRLQRIQQEVRVAASATGGMAARSLAQVQQALQVAGAVDRTGDWGGYGRAGAAPVVGRGFVQGDL